MMVTKPIAMHQKKFDRCLRREMSDSITSRPLLMLLVVKCASIIMTHARLWNLHAGEEPLPNRRLLFSHGEHHLSGDTLAGTISEVAFVSFFKADDISGQ